MECDTEASNPQADGDCDGDMARGASKVRVNVTSTEGPGY